MRRSCSWRFGAALSGLLKAPIERFVVVGMRGLPSGLPGLEVVLNLPGQPLLAHLNLACGGTWAPVMAGARRAGGMAPDDVGPGFDWRWRGSIAEAVFESDFGWKIVVDKLGRRRVPDRRFSAGCSTRRPGRPHRGHERAFVRPRARWRALGPGPRERLSVVDGGGPRRCCSGECCDEHAPHGALGRCP